MAHIFRAPPDVAVAREKLFNPTELQTWKPEQYDTFWPYATNFWSHRRSTPLTDTQGGARTSYYYCRLYRKEQAKSKGAGERKKTIRRHPPCGKKIQVVTVWDAGVPCRYEISGYGNVPEHNHTMDDLDAIKRNQRIKDVVAASVQDGFRPAEIADAVKASYRSEGGVTGAV